MKIPKKIIIATIVIFVIIVAINMISLCFNHITPLVIPFVLLVIITISILIFKPFRKK